MDRQLGNLIISWLQKLNVPVASSFIRRKLLSHPDYPSLVSITDTLDELNMEGKFFAIGKFNKQLFPDTYRYLMEKIN